MSNIVADGFDASDPKSAKPYKWLITEKKGCAKKLPREHWPPSKFHNNIKVQNQSTVH